MGSKYESTRIQANRTHDLRTSEGTVEKVVQLAEVLMLSEMVQP